MGEETTMKFYLSLAAKYANLRTFEAPGEGSNAGGGGDTSDADAAKAVADAKAAADAAAKAAANSSDPALLKLANEKAELLREVMDKKEKLAEAKAAAEAAQEALKAYGGVDPEKVKALLKQEAEAEAAAAEARGDFERLKKMMADEHEKAMKALRDELETERSNRGKDVALIDELTIGNAFGNSEFIREDMTISPEKARRLYGEHFERKGAQVVAYDKPVGAANRTMLVDASGNPLSFEDALKRIVDADPDKKGVLRSRAKAGAGSNSDAQKGAEKKPSLSGKAQIAAAVATLEG